MDALRVEPTLHKSHGTCPHCGGEEQTVWGNVYVAGQQRAVYYVRWTAGHRRQNITFLVSVGSWANAAPGDRQSTGLACRIRRGRPGFMVIDAARTPWGLTGDEPVLGRMLSREAVIGTALATEVFHMIDEIIVHDARVREFLRTGVGVDGHGVPVRRWWQFWRRRPQASRSVATQLAVASKDSRSA